MTGGGCLTFRARVHCVRVERQDTGLKVLVQLVNIGMRVSVYALVKTVWNVWETRCVVLEGGLRKVGAVARKRRSSLCLCLRLLLQRYLGSRVACPTE